jgi:hypothetical protein
VYVPWYSRIASTTRVVRTMVWYHVRRLVVRTADASCSRCQGGPHAQLGVLEYGAICCQSSGTATAAAREERSTRPIWSVLPRPTAINIGRAGRHGGGRGVGQWCRGGVTRMHPHLLVMTGKAWAQMSWNPTSTAHNSSSCSALRVEEQPCFCCCAAAAAAAADAVVVVPLVFWR